MTTAVAWCGLPTPDAWPGHSLTLFIVIYCCGALYFMAGDDSCALCNCAASSMLLLYRFLPSIAAVRRPSRLAWVRLRALTPGCGGYQLNRL